MEKGILRLTKDIDQLTEGELELLLAKQLTEINQMNAAQRGHTRAVQGYEEAIGVINQCLASIDNPDAICGIGEQLEAVGKAKKGGKTKAGKVLQKIGKGIKKGAKAITKVVTAPLRLAAKGAMEIYLPKAAPFFLYLFYDKPEKLPDAMKRKRLKAEKFKKFVVNGLGMKDAHFMGIIRNNLTKRFGTSPEAFLAAKLKAAGIQGIGRMSIAAIGKAKAAKKKVVKHTKKAPPKKQAPKAAASKPVTLQPLNNARAAVRPQLQELSKPVTEVLQQAAPLLDPKGANKKLGNLFGGDLITTAINALIWLVQKIASLGKKEDNPGTIEAGDFPDPDNDIGDAFNYTDLKQDYSNVPPTVKEELKQVVTELIVKDTPLPVAEKVITQAFPDLKPAQVQEMVEEVDEGLEPISDAEVNDLAADVKKSANPAGDRIPEENGGGSKGFCGGLLG